MDERVISRLTPRPARRALAVGSPAGLGLVILWLAAAQPAGSVLLLIGLLVLAAASLGFSFRVWRATAVSLELTETGLREAGRGGRVLCLLTDVDHVERGLLAWKPSGGFAIHLTASAERTWAPGLWWRGGKRVMVGGATNGGEAKAMADLMRLELLQRTK
ncbi:MAG: hypothetical protein AAGA70_08195 [Pseudomonadota bacterium]